MKCTLIQIRPKDLHHVCHQARPSDFRGGIVFIACGGIDHCAVPFLGLWHLEATAMHFIYLVLANRPLKLEMAYLLLK
jgi:hypothetical protein